MRTQDGLDRRSFLKTAGAGLAAGVALTGHAPEAAAGAPSVEEAAELRQEVLAPSDGPVERVAERDEVLRLP